MVRNVVIRSFKNSRSYQPLNICYPALTELTGTGRWDVTVLTQFIFNLLGLQFALYTCKLVEYFSHFNDCKVYNYYCKVLLCNIF